MSLSAEYDIYTCMQLLELHICICARDGTGTYEGSIQQGRRKQIESGAAIERVVGGSGTARSVVNVFDVFFSHQEAAFVASRSTVCKTQYILYCFSQYKYMKLR